MPDPRISQIKSDHSTCAEIVQDACMKCGRPWDGRTLPASYTKAWCPKCEAYTRFAANTYVPKSEREDLKTALAEIQKIAAREWAADETNYEWYGDIAGIAEEALGLGIGGGSRRSSDEPEAPRCVCPSTDFKWCPVHPTPERQNQPEETK